MPKDKGEAFAEWVAQEVAWSGGFYRPWQGLAALEPQLLADLCGIITQYVPKRQIDRLMAGERFADIVTPEDEG